MVCKNVRDDYFERRNSQCFFLLMKYTALSSHILASIISKILYVVFVVK